MYFIFLASWFSGQRRLTHLTNARTHLSQQPGERPRSALCSQWDSNVFKRKMWILLWIAHFLEWGLELAVRHIKPPTALLNEWSVQRGLVCGSILQIKTWIFWAVQNDVKTTTSNYFLARWSNYTTLGKQRRIFRSTSAHSKWLCIYTGNLWLELNKPSMIELITSLEVISNRNEITYTNI